jgi:DNA polymerase-3 subunit delta
MLRAVGADMELLEGEIQKLAAYKKDDLEIKQADIDAICSKSLETKIFDMLDAIGSKRPEVALEIYNNMLTLKESPIKILTMIIRQFRLLYQTKYLLAQGYNGDGIANRLSQRPFVIKALMAQVKNFHIDILMKALEDCLDTDLSIKTGKMSGEAAVEMLIIKYSIVNS